ncbi:hypothetical protein ABK040_002984 [Willaertia magna]
MNVSKVNDQIPTFKLIVIGDGGVGKTCFVNSIVAKKFEPSYIATLGVTTSRVEFNTSKGKVRFDLWDTAGPEKFGGLRAGYYINASCAIIMFDVTSRLTYKNVPSWYKDITKICGENIPIVMCGNKIDVGEENRKVKTMNVTFHKKKNIEYFEMSVKNQVNCINPIIYLTRKLLNSNVMFMDYEINILGLNIFTKIGKKQCTDITINCLE